MNDERETDENVGQETFAGTQPFACDGAEGNLVDDLRSMGSEQRLYRI